MDEKSLMKIFKAIANENRFAVLKFLRKNKEMSVGDLAEITNSAFRSVSRNLHFLRKADLVQCRNHFSKRLYSINMQSFPKEFLSFLEN